MFADSLLRNIYALSQGISDIFRQPIHSFCRLNTANMERDALIADDGAMISFIEIKGSLKMADVDSFRSTIDKLSGFLSQRFKGYGHHMHVMMDYDPANSKAMLQDAIEPTRQTALKYGMDMDIINSLTDDQIEALSRFCTPERVLFALWTFPGAMPPSQLKSAFKEMRGNSVNGAVKAANCQDVDRIVPGLSDIHTSFVSGTISALSDAYILAENLTAHGAIWQIRHSILPEITSRGWRAMLPGDPLPGHIPEPEAAKYDASSILYPSIKKQIWSEEGEDIDRTIEQIGDRLHMPIAVSKPPDTPKPFQVLFGKLVNMNAPWRICLSIGGNGMGVLGWRGVLSTIFSRTSKVNKQFNAAMENLKARENNGETIVSLQITLDTWVPAHEPDAIKRLNEQGAKLIAAVQNWGSADATKVYGDPLYGVTASIPGMLPNGPGPKAAGPLEEVLRLLPITRPASPWAHGSMLFRSPDGKLTPYAPNSSLQTAWIDVGVAPMGKGKSVLLALINLAFILNHGLENIPWLSITDVGPSSRGLIDLLKAMLPGDKEHLAAYYKLRMDKRFAVNPFDTPLGCRRPLDNHLTFLTNLCTLFATPLDCTAPQDGVTDIVRKAILMAYDELSDERHPKRYEPRLNPKLAEKVRAAAIDVDEHTSWWEIVDAFSALGMTHEATLAQRYAVPLLSEVAAKTRDEVMASMYNFTTPGGEAITNAVWRMLISVVDKYPIFAVPTQFDIGEARVVALDLNDVAPKGGPDADRQTAIMYMLSFHLGASHFFLDFEDLANIPDAYHEYHTARIKSLKRSPKRIAVDEFHRASKNETVVKQYVGTMEMIGRETRKWITQIGLYSQMFEDIPDSILELATSFYVLGVGSMKTAHKIAKHYNMPGTAANFMYNIGKPDSRGSSLLALIKTSEGEMIQPLMATTGVRILSALSTIGEDREVRMPLYQRIGIPATLEMLARYYPGEGAIKREVERRRKAYAEDVTRTINVDVIEELIDELADKWARHSEGVQDVSA